MADDPKEQYGSDQAKHLIAAIFTVTFVAGAFWITAWMILDYFGA